jgi:hypothetical protein
MKLKTFDQINAELRRKYTFLIVVSSIFFPMFANPVSAESKWYEKPFAFMVSKTFEWFLEPFIGLHEPAYYIFYQNEGKIWGLYTQAQFTHAIQNGYNMLLFVVAFLLGASIISMGVTHGYSKFSSSMKADITDNAIKILIAIVLLFQFFRIIDVFFTMNHYFVTLFESGIKNPVSLRDLGATVLTSQDGSEAGEKIEFTDLSNGEGSNWIKDAIVSFFALGVSIWFKAYYIQRQIMISGLILLAPVWISTLFFPKLQGITGYAFKELWAQTMAQTIHAAVFWLYFWLFNSSTDWLTYIIALAVFIPISEALRFAMGATSESSGKIATIGTLAGAGAIMHGAKAVSDIKNGFKNGYRESKGYNDPPSNTSQSGSRGNSMVNQGQSGNLQNSMNENAIMNSFNPMMGQGEDRQYGGAVQSANVTPNKFTQRMRTAGHIAGGFGAAVNRMGGSFAGMGLSPFMQHGMAEAGASMGQQAGYATGVTGFGIANGAADKVRNVGSSLKENFNENPLLSKEDAQNSNLSSFERAKQNTATATRNIGSASANLIASKEFRTNPQARRATLQNAGGVMGEAFYGRQLGYQMGADAVTSLAGKGVENPQLGRLDQGANYAVVTERDLSYLALRNNDNTFTPISNYGPGDTKLEKGTQVIQNHNIQTGGNGVRKMVPTSEQYAIQHLDTGNGVEPQMIKVDSPVRAPHVNSFINQESTIPSQSNNSLRKTVQSIDEQPPLPNINNSSPIQMNKANSSLKND